jgi:hypothetical protein
MTYGIPTKKIPEKDMSLIGGLFRFVSRNGGGVLTGYEKPTTAFKGQVYIKDGETFLVVEYGPIWHAMHPFPDQNWLKIYSLDQNRLAWIADTWIAKCDRLDNPEDK